MTETESTGPDADTATRECPFEDCEWSIEYDPDDCYGEYDADYKSERHYEREHAGRVEIQVTLEREQMLGDRDPDDIRERVLAEEDFGAWAVAHVRTRVLEEPDDHDTATS